MRTILLAVTTALAAGAAIRPVAAQAPETHQRANFLERHGTLVRQDASECQVCHTRENCLECHLGTPQVADGFFPASSGQALGVDVRRHAPPSHEGGFRDRHATQAAASSQTCAACHVRSDCLDCHRPSSASAGPGYHPADFLSRHPAEAYARLTSCADCHSATAFCASCHQSSGLAPTGPLGRGFHDAKQAFLAGHATAARQSLETCVTCHTQQDCLACHSATGVGGLSPHGPSFDAERLKQKNPAMCGVCHGTAIP